MGVHSGCRCRLCSLRHACSLPAAQPSPAHAAPAHCSSSDSSDSSAGEQAWQSPSWHVDIHALEHARWAAAVAAAGHAEDFDSEEGGEGRGGAAGVGGSWGSAPAAAVQRATPPSSPLFCASRWCDVHCQARMLMSKNFHMAAESLTPARSRQPSHGQPLRQRARAPCSSSDAPSRCETASCHVDGSLLFSMSAGPLV